MYKTILNSFLLFSLCSIVSQPTLKAGPGTIAAIGVGAVVTVFAVKTYMQHKEAHKNDWMQSNDPKVFFKKFADETEGIAKEVRRIIGEK